MGRRTNLLAKEFMRNLSVAILFVCTLSAHAQTVATCPTAVAGSAWPAGKWMPCVPAVSYIAQPIPATAIVNDMRCPIAPACVFSWQNPAKVLPTDQVWIKTSALPNGTWVKASTLNLVPPYMAPAVVSWTAPTANTDNSPLTDLAGYNVYEGASPTALAKIATVPASALIYTLQMGVGTMYFAVTALNSDSPPAESAQSAVVSKSLAAPTSAVPNPPVMTP